MTSTRPKSDFQILLNFVQFQTHSNFTPIYGNYIKYHLFSLIPVNDT